MSGFHLIINVINVVYDKTIALQTILELLAWSFWNKQFAAVEFLPYFVFLLLLKDAIYVY